LHEKQEHGNKMKVAVFSKKIFFYSKITLQIEKMHTAITQGDGCN